MPRIYGAPDVPDVGTFEDTYTVAAWNSNALLVTFKLTATQMGPQCVTRQRFSLRSSPRHSPDILLWDAFSKVAHHHSR